MRKSSKLKHFIFTSLVISIYSQIDTDVSEEKITAYTTPVIAKKNYGVIYEKKPIQRKEFKSL